ncbi:hypothetical protein [Nocardia alba]|uniref:Uncharacterized protein n=1 Tax=Nocardia alba TaxID=225051 RepID=A0A4R1FR73_9NOCA|nr:hypothetical protein [Nocardia alba]TCJ97397.1 hypothetical protein DFR71_3439 [Nocardia alba]
MDPGAEFVDVDGEMSRPSPRRGLPALGATARRARCNHPSACDGIGSLVIVAPTSRDRTGHRMAGLEKLLFSSLYGRKFSHR